MCEGFTMGPTPSFSCFATLRLVSRPPWPEKATQRPRVGCLCTGLVGVIGWLVGWCIHTQGSEKAMTKSYQISVVLLLSLFEG